MANELKAFGLVKDVTAINGVNEVTIRFTDSYHHEAEFTFHKDELMWMLQAEADNVSHPTLITRFEPVPEDIMQRALKEVDWREAQSAPDTPPVSLPEATEQELIEQDIAIRRYSEMNEYSYPDTKTSQTEDSELAALRRENEALREVLRPFASFYVDYNKAERPGGLLNFILQWGLIDDWYDMFEDAAQALSTDEGA